MIRKAEVYWPLVLLLALIKFVLPLFIQSPVFELQRDELLYYQQGHHLALGYLENPSLMGLMASISSLFGGSVAWIKFWPCLVGAGTVVVTCLLTAELGGGRFAQFLASLGIMSGAFVRIGFLFQPNMLDIFCWALTIYFLLRYMEQEDARWVYGIALSIALGWWSKYSILFMAIAVAGGLLLSRHRRLFLSGHTWIAIGIALVLIAPNIAWQYLHNWPLLHHMRELQATQLGFVSKSDFIKDQLLMLLPVLPVWLAGLVATLRLNQFRIIALIYFIIIALLLAGSGKAYYALGAYPMLLAAGAAVWERWTAARTWTRWIVGLVPIILTALLMPFLLPSRSPASLADFFKRYHQTNKWEDQQLHPLPQDYADMLGWKQLASKASVAYRELPDSVRTNTVIVCDNYGQAGALDYYGDPVVRENLVCFSGSYQLWNKLPTFSHLLYVCEKMPDEQDKKFIPFGKPVIAGRVDDKWSRQDGNYIIFYRDVTEPGQQALRDLVLKRKAEFAR